MYKPICHQHSKVLCLYHLVVVTKYRHETFTKDVNQKLFEEVIRNYPLQIHEFNIDDYNHFHMLIQAPSTLSPAEIARIVKGCSTVKLRKLLPKWEGWSKSYFIATVGEANIEIVENYIKNQGRKKYEKDYQW